MNPLRTRIFSVRDRRALEVGLVTIVFIVMGRMYPTWRNWEHASRDEADRSAVAVGRLVAAVRGLPAARDSVAARRLRLAGLRGSVITASSNADAAAALVAQLSGLLDDEPVRVLSMSVRSSTALSTGTLRVAVRASVLTEIDGLAGILRAIERSPLMLAAREPAVEPAGATVPSAREQLRVDLVVEALAFLEESSVRYAQIQSAP